MPVCYRTCNSLGSRNPAGATDKPFCCRLQEETMDNCLQKLRAACSASVSVKSCVRLSVVRISECSAAYLTTVLPVSVSGGCSYRTAGALRDGCAGAERVA